jgi:microsomal dipeptidase-like Zn-dependent dipeptidase
LIRPGWVDAVLLTHNLPELGTDLVSALSSLDVQNLTHLGRTRSKPPQQNKNRRTETKEADKQMEAPRRAEVTTRSNSPATKENPRKQSRQANDERIEGRREEHRNERRRESRIDKEMPAKEGKKEVRGHMSGSSPLKSTKFMDSSKCLQFWFH